MASTVARTPLSCFHGASVGARPEVLRALTPGNRAEPKMLSFHAHRSLTDRDTFVLVEHYSDPDGYDEHRATAAFREHVLKIYCPVCGIGR
ncbi:antibiotic biosynthesis monooxygenase [Pseudonocardia kujensis]|uniref:putative quinol monooxygenase n=1 Tax=Pseudonocardia kujensis TaxID=1128675 RepID=UPI001E5243C2|nr:antibiotic biosynthesis monooxygenase [Pseudonocardia kujensis]MCE0761429.1 antibiotic biosynthesis monooxygenase [Pseudonocardia kujensis]